MKAILFLLVSWSALAIVTENTNLHQSYYCMFGAWIGVITTHLIYKDINDG